MSDENEKDKLRGMHRQCLLLSGEISEMEKVLEEMRIENKKIDATVVEKLDVL